jgi:hypothetical protein
MRRKQAAVAYFTAFTESLNPNLGFGEARIGCF